MERREPAWALRVAQMREAFDEGFAAAADPAVRSSVAVLLVTVGRTRCAIPVRECGGVFAAATIVAVPGRARGFRGFTSAGGMVRPVYDLAPFLGLTPATAPRPPLVLAERQPVVFVVDAIENHVHMDGEAADGAIVSIGGVPTRIVALDPVVEAIVDETREMAARRSGRR